jgi:hypothetical protein
MLIDVEEKKRSERTIYASETKLGRPGGVGGEAERPAGSQQFMVCGAHSTSSGRIPMGLPLVAFPQAFFPLHGPLRR